MSWFDRVCEKRPLADQEAWDRAVKRPMFPVREA